MVRLEPVDAVEVTLVVDNFVDIFLASAEGARRLPLAYDLYDHQQLVAEHGFSALVTVKSQGRRSSILYDGGMTPRGPGGPRPPPPPPPLPLLIPPGAGRDHNLPSPPGAELPLPPPSRADLE